MQSLSSYAGSCAWLSKPLDEDHYLGHQVFEGSSIMLVSGHTTRNRTLLGRSLASSRTSDQAPRSARPSSLVLFTKLTASFPHSLSYSWRENGLVEVNQAVGRGSRPLKEEFETIKKSNLGWSSCTAPGRYRVFVERGEE